VDIGGLAAVRMVSTRRGKGFDLTWVAHRGHVYRIVGTAPDGSFARLKPIFRAVARSFHPLTAAERDRIRVERLRVARARAGESLAALVERTGSSWSAEEAAIANGLAPGTALAAGQPVKLAIPERHG
jgi:predicted Zn-dependent protease